MAGVCRNSSFLSSTRSSRSRTCTQMANKTVGVLGESGSLYQFLIANQRLSTLFCRHAVGCYLDAN